jgi:hypothetical protein
MHPNLNWFFHAANIILVVGYSVRDVLWLRLLAAASSLIALPFFSSAIHALGAHPVDHLVRRHQPLPVLAPLC